MKIFLKLLTVLHTFENIFMEYRKVKNENLIEYLKRNVEELSIPILLKVL